MTRPRSSSRPLKLAATVVALVSLACMCSLSATCSPLPANRHSGPPVHCRPARSFPLLSLHDRSPPPAPPPQLPSGKPISISVPCMTIDLTCPMSDAQFCANVADSISRAATRLVSAMQLATTARVRVSFFSKCVDSTCPDTLAATVPSRSLTVWVPDDSEPSSPHHESDANVLLPARRPAGRLVEYPQLVLRNIAAAQNSQLLANSGSLLDPDYDVHMRLSADQQWWFPVPAPSTRAKHAPPIRPNQFDLTMVVLHELVHALGFGSVNLMQAGNGVPMMLPIAELRTVKEVTDKPEESNAGGVHQEVMRFRAPSIFESHLTSSSSDSTPLADLARDILRVVDDATSLPATIDTVNGALGHPSALHAASTLYTLATTPDAVTFSPSQTSLPLVIETSLTPLSPGSSLTHLAQAQYSSSPDFLMTYQIPRGKTLDQLSVALGAGEAGLGPCTLAALRALGFKVKGGEGEPARLSDRAYVLDRVVVADLDRTYVPLVPGGRKVDGSAVRNAVRRSRRVEWWMVMLVVVVLAAGVGLGW